MRRMVRVSGGVSLLAAVAITIAGAGKLHPAADSPHYQPLMAGANMPADVAGIIGKACQDCHSDKTEWPWYAHVLPMSVLVAKDVEEGRTFMNLSAWPTYSGGRKIGYLAAITSAVTAAEMPPKRYTIIHSDARLSPEERQKVAGWAATEMARIQKGRQPVQ